jgi:hypothetical protein
MFVRLYPDKFRPAPAYRAVIFGAVCAREVSPRLQLRHEARQKITFVKFLIKLFSKSLWGVGQSPTTCNCMRKACVNGTEQKRLNE